MSFLIDVHISTYIQKRLFDRFLEIFENIMTECRISSKIINSPLRVNMKISYFISILYCALSIEISYRVVR
jgi:hypothetical protein